MNYEDALVEVNRRLRFGVKPGLERITALTEKLGSPQKDLRFVHVAGTNGKGTACALISSALKESGYRVGLYTSPYVLDFRERFQVDGEMISKEELIAEVEIVSRAAGDLEASGETFTEFEFITALAFDWFRRKNCDIVVLEVGLGGRFDATNVIDTPEAAVIMSISLDHTAVLGGTLAEIAYEKAGIIKPGGRAVFYPEQDAAVWQVLRTVCREREAQMYIPYLKGIKTIGSSVYGTEFEADGEVFKTPFLGEHQVKNAATALLALDVLRERGFKLPKEKIRSGFERAFIPARMEIISEKPLVLLDGGHNPGCAAALRDALNSFVPGKKAALMGIMEDKDSREYLRLLAPLFKKIVTVKPDNPRALDAERFREEALEFCPDVLAAKTPVDALELLTAGEGEDLSYIICGSFYLAAEMRPLLLERFGKK